MLGAADKWSDHHRLRKYRRKVAAAFRRGSGYDRLLTLKWRYWRRVEGPHVRLWE
jgi:hypothetical protein